MTQAGEGALKSAPQCLGVGFEIKGLPDLTTWQPGKEGCLLHSPSSEPQRLGRTPEEMLEEAGGASSPELHLASSLTLSLTLFLSLFPSHPPTLLHPPQGWGAAEVGTGPVQLSK